MTNPQPQRETRLVHWMNLLFLDESAIRRHFETVPWRRAGLCFGLICAVARLILVQSPAICYLQAVEKVKGIEVTLPEAMASVQAWAWYGLIITPPLCLLLFLFAGWLAWRVSHLFKGEGSFTGHLGVLVTTAFIILAGRIMGYSLLASTDLKRLTDLRDLSPGIGLGLFSFFSLERIGPFFWEIVRGLDLFGVTAIFAGARLLRILNGYKKSIAGILTVCYYALFIFLQWLLEGPGHRFWLYFWTSGNV